MRTPPNHWSHHAWEAAGSLLLEPGEMVIPLSYLIGAGGSLSSRCPGTEQILAHCKEERSDVFPTDRSVYEQFSQLTRRERDQLTRRLFKNQNPNVGYRCMAAMAKGRPIFVVNLNWDSCLKMACDRADVPFERFDLVEVERGRRLMREAIDHGHGVVCAHVHGYLDDDREGSKGIRLAHQDTLSFKAGERELLVDLLGYPTVVVGTSLVGHQDVHQLLDALAGDANLDEEEIADEGKDEAGHRKPEPLWVFERGDPSRIPRFGSKSAKGLSRALIARDSFHNFVSNTDVDFDALLVTLRSREVGFPWRAVRELWQNLPETEKIVPPDPEEVLPLLDGDRSLVVGAPHVGSTTLAFMVAWWRCLLSTNAGRGTVLPFHGIGQALERLDRDPASFDAAGAIVIDDLLDDRHFDEVEGDAEDAEELRSRLAEQLSGLSCPVLATASPDATLSVTCERKERLMTDFAVNVVSARSLWRSSDLRAWARARGGEQAEVVCREVRMGLISTPSQAIRRFENQTSHEQGKQWRARLRQHLDRVYRPGEDHRALVLAMVRLQDFSVPQSARSLDRVAGPDASRLIDDPWGLCMPIELDHERYFRLSSPSVVRVVDDWMASGLDALSAQLQAIGWPGRWAVDALARWNAFRVGIETQSIPADDPNFELSGTEYFRRALQDRDLDLALKALWSIWEAEPDHWTVKDVALDLVLEWRTLGHHPRARELRNSLLKAESQMGAYALFEAMMRVGRPVPLDLWAPVVAWLLELAAKLREGKGSRDDRRQVALSLDAMLWRPCPAGREQERKLIKAILSAADEDGPLKATIAAACAYHFHGAQRLTKAGLDLPLAVPSNPDPLAAQEMAWVVEWHFAHQSRCRAAASRRTFLSTIDGSESAPRYLDRIERREPLEAQHKAAVIRYVDALLRRPETIEWGVHLAMNIHTTTGGFLLSESQISRLREALEEGAPKMGIIAAALTYKPVSQVHELLSAVFPEEALQDALRKGIREGVRIDGIKIAEPRFSMWADPWTIRDRWCLTKRLPLGVKGPQELIEKLAERVDPAVEAGLVSRADAERAISVMWHGDLRVAEAFRRPRSSKKEDDFLKLLLTVIEFYASENDAA